MTVRACIHGYCIYRELDWYCIMYINSVHSLGLYCLHDISHLIGVFVSYGNTLVVNCMRYADRVHGKVIIWVED